MSVLIFDVLIFDEIFKVVDPADFVHFSSNKINADFVHITTFCIVKLISF